MDSNHSGKALNQNPNYMSWKDGKLDYDGQPLEIVFRDLKRVYNMDIKADDPSILSNPWTSPIISQSSDTIIRIICASFNLSYCEGWECLPSLKKITRSSIMPLVNGYIARRISAVALLILLICHQPVLGQENILDSLFTFRAGQVKTGTALDIITRQTGYNFTYDSRLINEENKTNLSFNSMRLEIILDSILKSDSLVYTVIDKYIIISRALPSTPARLDSSAPEEVFYISGIISDAESKEPLPFATAVIKNTGKGMVSNAAGEFGLNITRESLH